jgi:thiamine-monophosphate kinase
MMTLAQIGEFGFIQRIGEGCVVRPGGVVKGIGDDAAVFKGDRKELMLLTTDMLVERVHFSRHHVSGFFLGRKCLTVNLSDIAAMGGTPLDAFVSLAVPQDCSLDYLEALYQGLKSLARECQVNILGGDTTGSKTDLIINVCLTGYVAESEILCRHTACIGDIVYVTGCLGDSRAGLQILQKDVATDSSDFPDLLRAHLAPKAHLKEGRFLAKQSGVHAALDVSDGLSSDVGHIVEQSRVGVRIFREKIPISAPLKDFCDRFGFDPVQTALAGGEDYVLLATASPKTAHTLEAAYEKKFHRPIYAIGEITDTGRMELIGRGGETEELDRIGWDHFKAKGMREE